MAEWWYVMVFDDEALQFMLPAADSYCVYDQSFWLQCRGGSLVHTWKGARPSWGIQKSHPTCSLLTELVLGKLPSPTDEFCLAKDKLLSLASTMVTDNRDLVLANEQ